MSTTIDERVVEMRFDNKQFESNASTSMSTLKKLKESLKFSGATKGLEEIDAASKRVNMSGLGGAVDSVKARFSALQVVGVTALANITNSAINAGKNIAKSLTIDPIKSGFNEYETKMGSIQTILANTEHQGTTLDDVTAALDKLNLYADKTIYNFQEMTRNIGTFTAAGVDLETSVRSIQGIANLAAVSGSTSQQASTAMYQLSQALATGSVKLQDWNSVVNAGMGGKVFQNALIQTAAVLDGAADDVAAWQAKNIDAFGSFRESLTRGEWLTSEVLTRTLEQFTMAAEEGSETWKEYKKSLMGTGYTEAQAESILKMANTASDAATKVKTFTQLMDTLKESAQSGWAQTWEIIIGDFEEAKAFFTELSDLFGGIIGKSADRRNNFLSEVFASNWDKLISQINAAGVETERFEESIRKVAGDDKLDGLIEKYGSLEEAVRSGGVSSDILKKALDGIAETGADTKIAGFVDGLKEIKRTLRSGDTGEDVKKLQTALDSLGYDLGAPGIDGIIGPITEKAIKAFQEANGLVANGIVGDETLAALEKAGTKVEELEGNVGDLKSTCKRLVDTITQKSGRELLLDSLMNVIKAIQRPLMAVGEAFRDIFSISPETLYNGLEKLNKFSKSLVMGGVLDATSWDKLIDSIREIGIEPTKFVDKLSETLEKNGISVDKLKEKYGSLAKAFAEGAISIDIIKETLLGFDGITESMLVGGETADKIRRSFAGLFAVLEMIAKVTGGVFKFAFDIVTEILGRFGLGILDVTASIGDFLVGINDTLEGLVDASKIVDFLMPHIEVFADTIENWISGLFKSLKNTEVFKQFESALGDLADAFRKFKNGEIGFSELLSGIGDFISKALMSIPIIEKYVTAIRNWFEAFKETPAVQKLVGAINSIVEAFKKLKAGEIDPSEFGAALGENLGKAISALPEVIKGAAGGFIEGARQIASDFIQGFQNGIAGKVSDIIGDIVGFCSEFISAFKEALGEHSPSVIAEEAGTNFLQGFINGIKAAISAVINAISGIGEKIVGAFNTVWNNISEIAGKIDWGRLFAGGSIIALVYSAVTISNAISRISKAIGSLGGLVESAQGVLDKFGKVLKSFSKVLDGISWDFKAKALLKMAIAIGILAAAVWLLAQIPSESIGMVWNAVGVIVVLAGVMVALGFAISKMGQASVDLKNKSADIKGVNAVLLQIAIAIIAVAAAVMMLGKMDPDELKQGLLTVAGIVAGILATVAIFGLISKYAKPMDDFGNVMIKLAASLLIMAYVAKIIGTMDPETLLVGTVFMAYFAALMVGLMAATRLIGDGGNVENIGGILIKMAAALLVMAYVAKILGGMDSGELMAGTVAMTYFSALMVGLMAATRLIGDGGNAESIGDSILKIAAALALMALVVRALGGMDPEELKRGEIAVGYFAALVVGLMAATRLIGAGGNVENIGKALLGVSGAIAIIAGIAILLSFMGWGSFAKGATMVTAFAAIIVGLMWATKLIGDSSQIATVGKTLMMVSGAIAILAGIAVLLGMVPTENLVKGVAAVTVLGIVMAVLIAVTSKAQKCIGVLLVLTLLVGVMGGLVFALAKFTDPNKALIAALSLAGLMAAMALVIFALGNLGPLSATALVGVVAMAALAAVLYGLTHVLASMDGLKNANANVLSLVLLAGACTIMIAILSTIGVGAISALVGVAALALLGLVLREFVWVLSSMEGLENARSNAITLSILAGACTIMVGLLAIVGLGALAAIAGVAALALLGLVLREFVWVLSSMEGLTNAEANALILTSLMETLGNVLVKISLLGPLAIIGEAAVLGLVRLIGIIGTMAVAIGALMTMTKFQQIQQFLDTGIPVLEQLSEGIGTMIGKLIGGVIAGVGSAVLSLLPQLGTALSMFMVGATPFITLAKTVDSSVIAGAGCLAAAILVLSAANFISGVTSILTLGQSSFASLGAQLFMFGIGAKAFSDTISGIDASSIEAASNIANMILTLTASEFISGIMELFGGGIDFGALDGQLQSFANAVVNFSSKISGNVDSGAVQAAASAGEMLVNLNKSLPRSGGWVQDIIGEQDFGKFASACTAFAACILEINNTLSQSGFKIQSEKIEQLVAAGTQFSDLNNALPRSGGIAQDLAGEKDLSKFGEACVAFARCLISINDALSQDGLVIQSDKLKQLTNAGTQFSDLNNALPKSGGIAQDLAGERDLSKFGEACVAFATCMIAVNAAVSQEGFSVNLGAIDQLKQAGDKMNELQDSLPKTGGWWQDVAGSQDIGDFGEKIATFATAIVDFSINATGLDTGAIDTALSAAERIKEFISDLVGMDYSGVADFTGVGSGWAGADGPVYDIGKAISKFSSSLDGINTENIAVATDAAGKLKALISGLAGLDTSGISLFTPTPIGSAIKEYSDKVVGIDTGKVSVSISMANQLKNLISELSGLDNSGASKFTPGTIGTNLKSYSDSVAGFNSGSVSSSVDSAYELKEFIASLVGLNTSGVSSFATAVTELGSINVQAVVDSFAGVTAEMATVGLTLTSSLAEGMTSGSEAVTDTVTTIVTGVNGKIISHLSVFKTAGVKVISTFASGMTSRKSNATSAASNVASSAANSARNYWGFYYAGSYCMDGLRDGINKNKYKVFKAVEQLAKDLSEEFQITVQIGSPSKLFEAFGRFLDEGLAIGIKDNTNIPVTAASRLGESTIQTMQDAISRAADVFSFEGDLQPTIRPVVDLSDVKTGVAAIDSMMLANRNVGLMADFRAISSNINARSQNGANDDIISAINKLGAGLENNRGDTYNFGDFTYDDGSNVADAVGTLIRYAKIGRRV